MDIKNNFYPLSFNSQKTYKEPTEKELTLVLKKAKKEREAQRETLSDTVEISSQNILTDENDLEELKLKAKLEKAQKERKIRRNTTIEKQTDVGDFMKTDRIQGSTSFNNMEAFLKATKQKTPLAAIAEKPQIDTVTTSKPSLSTKEKSLLATAGAIIAALLGLLLYKKGKKQGVEVLQKMISDWDVNKLGKTVDDLDKNKLLNDFINPIKNGKTPKNGFLVQGPDSKGKDNFFNWAIEQFRSAGVEIIDTTDPNVGHSTRKSILKIEDYLYDDVAEQFKKDKKYKLFVIRDLEKIENAYDTTSKILQGYVHDSAKRTGLMVAYKMQDSGNFYPAVTRMGRVDAHITPKPEMNESVDIWKEFINSIKKHRIIQPHFITKTLAETREILSKRGDDALKELEPYLKYEVPYEIPNRTASVDFIRKYLTESSKILDDMQKKKHFTMLGENAARAYHEGYIDKKKYETVKDMLLAQFEGTEMKEKLNDYMQLILNTAR